MASIYNPSRNRAYELELGRLEQSNISKENKELIRKYHDHLFASGSGENRVAKVSSQLRKIVPWIGKNLRDLDIEDLQTLVARFNRNERWADATKKDYARALKQLFSWYEEHDPRLYSEDTVVLRQTQQFYRAVSKVKTAYKEPSHSYSDIINEDDIHKVLNDGCMSAKQRAFLSVLHEGGFRAGELLNMRFKDIEFKLDRVMVKVDGKTGERRVPLVWCMGYLSQWLEQHPGRGDPEMWVWISEARRPNAQNKMLKHGGGQKLINRCFEIASVTKRHNFHWFRHSRATLNAPHMTEIMLCKFFGWAAGSKQVRRYVHACVEQVEDAVLRMHGMQRQKERTPQVQRCACGMVNAGEARHCARCGKMLSAAVLLAKEEAKGKAVDEAMELLQKIMSDPVLKAKFEQIV